MAIVPDWTADGTRLRFGTYVAGLAPEESSPLTLHEASADGSRHVVLGTLPLDAWSPRWSPDGTRLAWLGGGGRTEADSFLEVWVGSTNGQNATRLFSSGAGNVNGTGPTWSPDGQWLAFGYTVGATLAGVTSVIGVDGTGHHQVASVEGPLAWLPATPAPSAP
jgi:Tol biopolymer transport system component